MDYYSTVKHHSTVGYWDKLRSKTLCGAKREATAEHGTGYIGHVIHLVGVPEDTVAAVLDSGVLNDIPPYTKTIGTYKWDGPR